jgi:hypothetical protein
LILSLEHNVVGNKFNIGRGGAWTSLFGGFGFFLFFFHPRRIISEQEKRKRKKKKGKTKRERKKKKKNDRVRFQERPMAKASGHHGCQ